MAKKYQKFAYTVFCLSIFLSAVFLNLPVNKVFALEVKYPAISGQTVTAESKLPDFMLYMFNVGMSIGFACVFVSLVVAGIMWFLSPLSAESLAAARDRTSGAISGLLILVLTYLIITTINPELNAFKQSEGLPEATLTATSQKNPGVYFYDGSACSDNRAPANASSIPDLGPLRKRVKAVKVVQDDDAENYYISILYSNPDFSGKCQYMDPNTTDCQTVDPFASSASIHRYDFDPNGDGVYFFRKTCFNKVENRFSSPADLVSYCQAQSSGWFKVENSEIKSEGIYMRKLEDLKFINVPEEEQYCVEYDKNGECTDRITQSLGGENISSVIINGDYLVLFSYAGPGETCQSVINTSCQEFPIGGNANGWGILQMKWQNIRNSAGVIPNCINILPIGS